MEKLIAFDVETYPNEIPFCMSICDSKLKTRFWRWDKEQLPEIIKKIMEDKSITKIAHNASFDISSLRRMDINVAGVIHDTLIMSKIGMPLRMQYGLKILMMDEELPFHFSCREYEEVHNLTTGRYKVSYDELPKKLLRIYNIKDSVYTMKLFFYLKDIINWPIYKLERQLIRTVVDMQCNGIRLNLKLTKLKNEIYQDELDARKRYMQTQGLDNPNSPKQVSELLYNVRKIYPPLVRGKEHPSTDDLSMKMLKHNPDTRPIDYKLIACLLKYRKYMGRLKFIQQILNNSRGSYIYPHFNQLGQIDRHRIKTGRFSSSNPNFQNIPRGDEIRELIIPRKNHFFLSFDYSQIEMRLFAFLAKDGRMMKSYHNDEDLHSYHQSIFVDPYRKDDGTNRQIAKNIGFEILYGIGVPGMLRFLNKMEIFIDKETVRKMLEGWHELHPSLYRYRNKLYGRLRENGFLEDVYGRKYFLPLNKIYVAVNYSIQGMSANIIKDVMPRVNRYVKHLDGKLLLTIHDELLIELPKHYLKKYKVHNNIKKLMELPGNRMKIPLKVDCAILKNNWGEK